MPIVYDPSGITFGSVIEEITSNLQGYTAAPDQVTSVATAVTTPTATEIYVDDADIAGRGLIEIGTELMWVQSVNVGANCLTILPRGRGWKGSVASTHAVGETVVVSPAAPRYIVAREINNHIRSLYPDIYAVETVEFPYNAVSRVSWEIPEVAVAILDVRWKSINGNWERVSHWEMENSASVIDFASGKTVRITQNIPIGATIQVVYAVIPNELVSETDLFASTGLSGGAKDLVVLGVMARIAPNLDVSRLSVEYVPAGEMATARPHGGAITVAKYLEAKYAQRVAQERVKLNRLYPARIHMTR